MAIAKLSGLAVHTAASRGTLAPASTAPLPAGARSFQERYVAASRSTSPAERRPKNSQMRQEGPEQQARPAPAGLRSSGVTALAGAALLRVPERNLSQILVRQRLPAAGSRKRSGKKLLSRQEKSALLSISDELNIVVREICIGDDKESITFLAQSKHWQGTEFLLEKDGNAWQLTVLTGSAATGEPLRQSEVALSGRFEAAGLGTIQLHVRQF